MTVLICEEGFNKPD